MSRKRKLTPIASPPALQPPFVRLASGTGSDGKQWALDYCVTQPQRNILLCPTTGPLDDADAHRMQQPGWVLTRGMLEQMLQDLKEADA